MLVVGFPTGAFQANCFLIAPSDGGPCVVVDPGQDAEEPLVEALREHRLSPVAVVLTHGHLDHTFSVTPVCDGNDVPAWIHPDDRYMLSDPLRGMSDEAARFFGPLTMREPSEVRELHDQAELDLAGLKLTVRHTPGHTDGSVSFAHTTEEGGHLLFSGDTLFAGSIGRTDLPGGSMARMTETLRTLLELDDETVVLPGHGPTTTIGRERVSNPFLTGLVDLSDPSSAHRGRGRGI
ncbi:glyoxylase-like metal-dependent hydrolase (beta-lactamase superfamily II) [Actinokineospora baliensis]|uniref:MBL fold metallo-hydrolase n=1 Tax=Actinokineospora baliensis TaxID=547056 RepID=UPI00195E28B5|nr:MBL fold metallo-hydrolase [Actinokineospora baliensis]MBM7775907.1 glyoxylase-like metal-dependent hydrolase (beta-lactamase superfamily II) [Actinokineospora baliensis]